MHVVVSEFGSFVGKKSERLVVRKGKETLVEVPLFGVEQVTIATSGASLSTDVIRECAERGIQINFLTSSGKPYAKLSSPNLTGTVVTRREQMLAYLDGRGVALSRAFVEGKMRNQAAIAKYFAKYRKDIDRELYGAVREGAAAIEALVRELEGIEAPCIDEVRGQLLSLEGRAASIYWECVKKLLVGKIEFDGRERRGAEDPFNSLLNYGYGILYTQVWGAVVLAGLEPFAGFLHVDRPGKPSLVLDLIEEFRQQVVDRTVIAMVNRGVEVEMEGTRLGEKVRKDLAARVLERLDAEEDFERERRRLKTIIQQQARRMASFVRGDGTYKPFVGGW